MNDANNHSDLFDSYLRRELSADETEAFRQRLESDSAFKAEFELHSLMAEGIREAGREQLKQFLKEIDPPRGGSVVPIRKWLYAAAAVLVLGGSLYLVTINMGSVKQQSPAKDIAISEQKAPEQVAADETQSEPEATTEFKSPIVTQEEATQPPGMPDTVMIAEKDKALDDTDADMYKYRDVAAGNRSSAEYDYRPDSDKNITVLEDQKIKDTTVIPIVITATPAFQNNNTNLSNNYELTRKYQTTLPANQVKKNDWKNISDRNRNASTDTTVVEIADNERESVSKVKAEKKTKSYVENGYTIEFWKSPVNFKGYSFSNKTIQLYGLKNHRIKLITYEEKLYLKAGDEYYLLEPTETHIPYKPVLDDTIIRQLSAD